MIIDFHTHIFPEKIAGKTLEKLSEMSNEPYFCGGTAEELSASMAASHVDLSIALPVVTAPKQFDSINRFAAEINKQYFHSQERRGILSLGGIHPDCEDYRGKLRQIQELGLKGIKLHPVYQQVAFDDPRFMQLVADADEAGLLVVTHAGYDVGFPGADFVSPAASRKLIDAVHPKKLVLAHMGGYEQWDEVEELLTGQDVYLDLAYTIGKMPEEQMMRIIRRHGAERILFATDCPWMDQGEQTELFGKLPLTEEERELISWKNAVRLLEL